MRVIAVIWVLFGVFWISPTADATVRHKFAILVNYPSDGNLDDVSQQIRLTVRDIIQEKHTEDTHPVQLAAQIIYFNTSTDEHTEINRLQITKDIVCKELLNDSIAVILVQNSISKGGVRAAFSATAYALGFYRVPTIGVMIQDAEFSRKNLYPTFLRTSPPFSNEATVILKLLNKLKYRQVVVITVEGDVNGVEFTVVFEEMRIEHEIHVQKYIELPLADKTVPEVAQIISREFEEVTSNTIILCAKRSNAETIIEAAPALTGHGKMWIVNQAASKAANLPLGFLTVQLQQNTLSALRDALVVIREGVGVLEKYEGKVLPPAKCSGASLSNEWTTNVGHLFYNHLIRSTFYGENNQIKFNNRGDRLSVAYKVQNRQHTQFVDVAFANDQSDIMLEENAIVWPGGSKVRPLEITLPRHLRAVTVADAPFVYTVAVDDAAKCAGFGKIPLDDAVVPGPWIPCPLAENEMFCCAGYVIDLLSNLSLSEPNSTIDTGFSFELHLNTSYGAVLLSDNGYALNGMVGELDSDLADLAIGALTINPEREHYIDFSEPWLYHGIRVLEKWVRQPQDSPMQSFLQPMQDTLWYALFGIVFFVGTIIYGIDLKSPFDQFYQNAFAPPVDPLSGEQGTEEDRVTFGEALWFVWGVLLNSGVSEKTPRSFSARVLGLVWCGFCMIMVASYTANLAAFLVLDQPENSLSGINDPRLRNPSANFSYATVMDTNTYQYFKRHVELSTMFRKMESHNVRTAKEAITALLNDTLGAFIWDSTRLEFEAMKNCELRTRGTLFGRSAYAVGLQKHSPWTPHITNAILRLAESGMMEKLDAKWIAGAGRQVCVYERHKTPARLGLANMKDVFVLIGGGILSGVFFCVIEFKVCRRLEKRLKQKLLARRYAAIWQRHVRQGKRTATSYSPVPFRKFSEVVTRSSAVGATRKISAHSPSAFNAFSSYAGRPRSTSPNSRPQPIRFRPDLNFTTQPAKCYCSRCRNAIETQPAPVIGRFSYTMMAFFIVTLMWPCAPLPCFLTVFADYAHKCPICGHIVGRFRRGAKPQFYV